MTATIMIFENAYARVAASCDKLSSDLKCIICGRKISIHEVRRKAEEKLGGELFAYLEAVTKQKQKWLEIDRKVKAKEIKSFTELRRLMMEARARRQFAKYEGHVGGNDDIIIECEDCGEVYHFLINWSMDHEVFVEPRFNWFSLLNDISELGDKEAEKAFRKRFGLWFSEYRKMALEDLEYYDQVRFWELVNWLANDFALGIPAILPSGYGPPKREVALPAPLVDQVERFAATNGLTLEKALIMLIKRGMELEVNRKNT